MKYYIKIDKGIIKKGEYGLICGRVMRRNRFWFDTKVYYSYETVVNGNVDEALNLLSNDLLKRGKSLNELHEKEKDFAKKSKEVSQGLTNALKGWKLL